MLLALVFVVLSGVPHFAQRPNWIWNGPPPDYGPTTVIPNVETASSWPVFASSTGFGGAIASIGDVDGDRRRDVVIGAPNAHAGLGAVYVISSSSGAVLIEVRGNSLDEQLGRRVCAPGDVDGDGRDDFAASGSDVFRVYDARGRVLRDVPFRGRAWPRNSITLTACGDLDGDGCDDVLVQETLSSTVLASRACGEHVWKPASPREVDCDSGFERFVLLGLRRDVDGDGAPDVIALETSDSDAGTAHWRRVRSGASGDVISESLATEAAYVDWHAALGADLDRDGVPEVMLGADAHGGNRPHALVASGRTLHELVRVEELAPGGYLEGFGASVAFVRNRREGGGWLAVGCEEEGDVGDAYYAAVFEAATGEPLASLSYERAMMHVASLDEDLDGDGAEELLVGLPEIGHVWIVSLRRLKDARRDHPERLRVLSAFGAIVDDE